MPLSRLLAVVAVSSGLVFAGCSSSASEDALIKSNCDKAGAAWSKLATGESNYGNIGAEIAGHVAENKDDERLKDTLMPLVVVLFEVGAGRPSAQQVQEINQALSNANAKCSAVGSDAFEK